MPLPNLPFGNLITSKQLISGQHINSLSQLLTGSAGGLTATAGGNAANSLQLSSAFNEVTTVVTGNDSVTLPPAKSGLRIEVTNTAGASLRIFANGTDTIKGAASYDLANGAGGTAVWFVAVKDGSWRVITFA